MVSGANRNHRRIGPQRSSQRRGVALLIVVACIVVAGLAMVSVTGKSLRLATDSVEKEAQLQQRWGVISLQHTLLTSAPKLFVDSDKRMRESGNTGPFPNSLQRDIVLGNIQFQCVLADEQAKLNLNAIYQRRGRSATALAARKMNEIGGLRLRLAPEVADTAKQGMAKAQTLADEEQMEFEDTPITPAFRHWGQVFDLSRLESLQGIPASQLLPAATSKLTCWGRGEVNITRATDDVVEESCRTLLGPGVARKLVRQYRENPVLNVNQVALQLEIDDLKRQDLSRLLTTQSSTYSLWLHSTSLHGTQRWLAVAAPIEGQGIRTERFRF